jgi:hypothetical protein
MLVIEIENKIIITDLKPFFNALFKLNKLKQRFGTYMTSFNVLVKFYQLIKADSHFKLPILVAFIESPFPILLDK